MPGSHGVAGTIAGDNTILILGREGVTALADRTIAHPDHGGILMEKAVLAYSGGLDTSVTIRWLSDQGYEVHAVAVDVGQREDFGEIVERGEQAGAASVRVVDAVDRYAAEFLVAGDQGERALRGEVPDGERASRGRASSRRS